jgi:hypothetical protein
MVAAPGAHAGSEVRPRVRLLADGKPFGDDLDWHLNPGDLVVIDESAMTNTPDIGAVHTIADATGARPVPGGVDRDSCAVQPSQARSRPPRLLADPVHGCGFHRAGRERVGPTRVPATAAVSR